MTKETFSVDTHLFRELGELLVGRDSTALVELIKNAYDADATEITVHGDSLENPEGGTIVIRDTGLGMTAEQFQRGFLRIASRVKEQGDRRSLRYKRRFTGAKGIGRLAAHKLARRVHVESVANEPRSKKPLERIEATIDWDKVESAETLDRIPAGAITLVRHEANQDSTGGTTITLKVMRRRWTARDLVRFVTEAQATVPPPLLLEPLPPSVVKSPLIFTRPTVESPRKAGQEKDPGWTLELSGNFDVGETYWRAMATQSAWVVEIDVTTHRAKYVVAPTLKRLEDAPDLERFEASIPLTDEDQSPAFQARILVREGTVSGGQPAAVRTWIQETHGIRVYMEGFRVLPYGELGDDWLRIDRMYSERSRATDQLSAALFKNDDDEHLGLVSIPNRQYLGAVFLTTEGAAGLQMLVNREGFVPNAAFLKLQDLVIAGIGLVTRVRAAANAADREARRKKRSRRDNQHTKTSTQQVVEAVGDASELLQEANKTLIAGDITAARSAISSLEALFENATEASKEVVDEQAMIRVLASLGAQSAGFVHEINGLLGLASAIDKSLNAIRHDLTEADSKRFGARLSRLSTQLAELRLALERQASYLTEIVSPDRRRRRSKQEIRKRFETAYKLLAQHAEKNDIKIRNAIPDELRSPPMFGAELVAVFTNLLTNAIKAVGRRGEILATGKGLADGTIRIRVENTGKRVVLSTAERWFLPFTSTTIEADPVLGMGMGLGLPITRRILDEYDATIAFVEPSKDFATAVEIRFKDGR